MPSLTSPACVSSALQALLLSSFLLGTTNSTASIDLNVCSVAQSDRVARAFTDTRTDDKSSCPDSFAWTAHLYSQDGPKERIFINAGVNKGYNFAEFLCAFAPWTGVHTGRWRGAMPHRVTDGVCNEGAHFASQLKHLETTFRVRDQPRILLVGIDLNQSNIKLVKAILNRLRRNHPQQFRNVSAITMHAKVSSTDMSKVFVPLCTEGEETCGHGQSNASATATTSSVTLDTIVSKLLQGSKGIHSGRKIDIIQIDTEGHDPLVLKGLTSVLQHRQSRAITFEYHSIGEWRAAKLRDVVESFAEYDYFCYIEGLHGRLWPLSGSCWSDLYEFRRWSNVACFDSSDSWYRAIQRFVVREPPFKTMFTPLEDIYIT